MEAISDTERLNVNFLQQDMFDELYQEEKDVANGLLAFHRYNAYCVHVRASVRASSFRI